MRTELSVDHSHEEARRELLARANDLHERALATGDLRSAVAALRLVAELTEAEGRVFDEL